MSWSFRKSGTVKELTAALAAAGPEVGNVAELDKHRPAINRLLVANVLKDDENGPLMELDASGHEYDGNGQVYIKLGPAAAVASLILLGFLLLFSAAPAAAADKLPVRVETNQVNPPAPVFQTTDAPTVELTATAATLPGQPVVKTAKAGRGALAWLFGRRCRRCSG